MNYGPLVPPGLRRRNGSLGLIIKANPIHGSFFVLVSTKVDEQTDMDLDEIHPDHLKAVYESR